MNRIYRFGMMAFAVIFICVVGNLPAQQPKVPDNVELLWTERIADPSRNLPRKGGRKQLPRH